jgi:hypothetical protein
VNPHGGDRRGFRRHGGYWGGDFYDYDNSCYPYLGVYPYCNY